MVDRGSFIGAPFIEKDPKCAAFNQLTNLQAAEQMNDACVAVVYQEFQTTLQQILNSYDNAILYAVANKATLNQSVSLGAQLADQAQFAQLVQSLINSTNTPLSSVAGLFIAEIVAQSSALLNISQKIGADYEKIAVTPAV